MLALLDHSYYEAAICLVGDLCRPFVHMRECYSDRRILPLTKIVYVCRRQASSSALYEINDGASIAVIKGVLSPRYIWEDAPGIGGFGVLSRRSIFIAGRRSQRSWIRWTVKAIFTSFIHFQGGAHLVDTLSAICVYKTWCSSSEWIYCLINTV